MCLGSNNSHDDDFVESKTVAAALSKVASINSTVFVDDEKIKLEPKIEASLGCNTNNSVLHYSSKNLNSLAEKFELSRKDRAIFKCRPLQSHKKGAFFKLARSKVVAIPFVKRTQASLILIPPEKPAELKKLVIFLDAVNQAFAQKEIRSTKVPKMKQDISVESFQQLHGSSITAGCQQKIGSFSVFKSYSTIITSIESDFKSLRIESTREEKAE